MNKQIRYLAEQAGLLVDRQYDIYIYMWSELDSDEKTVFLGRFAELIVRECMDVVSSKCASPTAYNALAEHFGVEE